MPKSFSNSKYVSSPDFKKQSNRKPFIILNRLKDHRSTPFYPGNPHYEPNLDSTRPSLSLGVPSFGKMKQRASFIEAKSFIVPEAYNPETVSKGMDM